jgi:hypothetical protein
MKKRLLRVLHSLKGLIFNTLLSLTGEGSDVRMMFYAHADMPKILEHAS